MSHQNINKEIYLIRHGQTDWNLLGKGQGQEANILLNNTGKLQAEKTGYYLKEYRQESGPFDCFMVSPMMRTRETALIISEILNYDGPIYYKDSLKERKHGKASGLVKSDPLAQKIRTIRKKLTPDDPIERFNSFDTITEILNDELSLGMETDQDLYERLENIIQEILDLDERKIIIIGHGGALLALIKKIFQIVKVPEGSFENGDNCWIAYLTWNETEGFYLRSPPNTEHLSLYED